MSGYSDVHRRSVREMLVARSSRTMLPVLACIVCVAVLVACLWNGRGPHRERFVLSGQSGAAQIVMSQKYVWVGESTIPGAGLGVFAKRDLPAGTPWNFEEAEEGNALVMNLPLWQSLSGFLEYAKEVGVADMPLQGLWAFFDVYGYTCDLPHASNVVGLLATSFTNHAPSPTVDNHPESHQQHSQPGMEKTSRQSARFANSVGDTDTEGWSAWQKCTVAYTLRDVSKGEELLEDFNLYSAPCRARGDCDDFYGQQPSGVEQADSTWAKLTVAQLEDVLVGNSTKSTGGVGVFAARDLPAGHVWNMGDVAHAWSITRKQWEQLLQMQKSLKAAGINKPVINTAVDAFRQYGYCCPLDGRLYLVFSPSILANLAPEPAVIQSTMSLRQRLIDHAASSSGGKKGSDVRMGKGQVANSMPVFLAEPGMTQALTVVEGCTWRQTVAPINKGEEILEAYSTRHTCNWPGFQN